MEIQHKTQSNVVALQLLLAICNQLNPVIRLAAHQTMIDNKNERIKKSVQSHSY